MGRLTQAQGGDVLTSRSRIGAALARARAEARVALVPYVMAGQHGIDDTVATVLALERGGADLVELGMPFSDPLADGPTIQRAATQALAAGTNTAACLDAVRRIRGHSSVPIVLMGYSNPLLRYGIDRFCAAAANAGADGVIVADLPMEEAGELRGACSDAGLDLVPLVAPTSPDRRIAEAVSQASGFVYCVALAGVTGARAGLSRQLPPYLQRVRAHTDLPLAVGFGVSTAAHVAAVARHADAAVVGSALIDALDQAGAGARPAAAERFMLALRSTPTGTRTGC